MANFSTTKPRHLCSQEMPQLVDEDEQVLKRRTTSRQIKRNFRTLEHYRKQLTSPQKLEKSIRLRRARTAHALKPRGPFLADPGFLPARLSVLLGSV